MPWQPIADLPLEWQKLAVSELTPLSMVWRDHTDRLQQSVEFQAFNEKLRREIAIETGIIERLYTIDRGTTRLLIEQGINEALIPHGTTDRPVNQVVSLIRDQEAAIEGLFDFVGGQRTLSTSYVKQLHQLLTQNQESTEALNTLTGNVISVSLVRGDWKRRPNNPLRQDGTVHEYCPPEQVASEMDRLVSMNNEHRNQAVSPEIEAAWLHHRFTQIHPFQDGNGRVARCLASLVFIQSGWFPLVLTRDDRAAYIDSLESADQGNLTPLITLFSESQKKAFLRSLSLSERVLDEGRRTQLIISSVAEKLKQNQSGELSGKYKRVEEFASVLMALASKRLKEVEAQIKSAFPEVESDVPSAVQVSATSSQANSSHHHPAIMAVAEQLEYFANLRSYHSWTQLVINVDGSIAILLSFHGLGHEYRGLLACSACVYYQELLNGEPYARGVRSLTTSPFQFSYADELDALSKRFLQWLEDVVVSGLEYWNQSI